MSDEGVTELLGYAILAGMVITAVICIASGTGGVIVSAAESASLSEATLAMRSLAATASNVAHVNNTYFTASEVQVPAGYELTALDGIDDVASFAVSCGDREVFSAREGSLSLRSPFRSITFEGGAVFCNDSGSVSVIRKPSVFTSSHEKGRSLYISLIMISADSFVVPGSRSVVLDVRAESRSGIRQPSEGTVTISISSMCMEGWSIALRERGFTVAQNGNKITATLGGVTDVCINCETLQVRVE
jgi:hypothetical protein